MKSESELERKKKTQVFHYLLTLKSIIRTYVDLCFLTYLAKNDREIRSHDGARFPCLHTGV